jgi:gamma-polyglutamate biosynthesis protein CapA
VVQEIEKYNNRLIFYSLGNFIFDQYFSVDTQQGLGVGLTFQEGSVQYSLVPITIPLSQPQVMDASSTKNFLQQLAKRSETSLGSEISNGVIVIKQ